jgi:hypothetical protein
MPRKKKSRSARAGVRWRRRQVRAGMCMRCGKNAPPPDRKSCHECYLRMAARKHLGSSRRWPELLELVERQGGKCAYSGRELRLGVNASIEHVEPQSKNRARARDITNIKIVDKDVNFSKGALSLGAFLVMCKEVLLHFGWEVTKDDSR